MSYTETQGSKEWANKLIWRSLYDDKKPHQYALHLAKQVLGENYIPHKPVSNNEATVEF